MNVSSPITRIFGGILRSAIKVPGAKESVVIEPFHSLHLDITPDDVSDINDAIWKLVEPEVLDGYISPTAATQQEHSGETVKQALFEHLPNVLILHFKRFTFVDGQIRKVTKHISYQLEIYIPVELLTTSTRHAGPVRYSLCAVVYHHGKRAVNGHYTCDLRRGDNRWFHFDDSVVSPIAVADVIAPHNGTDRSEYLLFYQKGL
jgi:ubiquitin C-terminal hydrolase